MVCGWREQLTDVVITSVDAPLVSPGLTFSPTGIISDDEHGQARPDLGWNFNLFNQQQLPSCSSRFLCRVCLIDRGVRVCVHQGLQLSDLLDR